MNGYFLFNLFSLGCLIVFLAFVSNLLQVYDDPQWSHLLSLVFIKIQSFEAVYLILWPVSAHGFVPLDVFHGLIDFDY